MANSSAAVTYLLGSNAGRIGTNTASGLNDAAPSASGTFNTTAPGGSAGVSFDFSAAMATNGGWAVQSSGFGVTGGTATSGIDNNGGSGPQETLTLSISNVTGLALGESLVITSVELSFGFNGGETYTINGGPDTNGTGLSGFSEIS